MSSSKSRSYYFGVLALNALWILTILDTQKCCCALNMRNNEAAASVFIIPAIPADDGEVEEDVENSESESNAGESETPMRLRIHDPTYQSPLKPQVPVQESTRTDPVQPKVDMNPRSNFGFIQSEETGNPFRKQDRPTIASELEEMSDSLDWDSLYKGQLKRAVRLEHMTSLDSRRAVRLQTIGGRSQNNVEAFSPSDPPPHEQVAKMARYIVKNSNWTSMATISSRNPIVGYPFANIFSISDGPLIGKSTGVPYMYLTPLEISVQDLEVDSRASLTMSLAQGNYCRIHSYDPEDPRCAHVILTGIVAEVLNSTSEADFARDALFSRHPEMPDWPKDHGWFFAKLNITSILVLDYFGGAKSVSLQDYFSAN